MAHQLECRAVRAIFRHHEQHDLPGRLVYQNQPAGLQPQPTSVHELVIPGSTTVPVGLRTHQHNQQLLVTHQPQRLPVQPLQPTIVLTGLAPLQHRNLQRATMIMIAQGVQGEVHRIVAAHQYLAPHQAVRQVVVHRVAVQAEVQQLEDDSLEYAPHGRGNPLPVF